jgi:hypothetical protein
MYDQSMFVCLYVCGIGTGLTGERYIYSYGMQHAVFACVK